MVRRRRLLTALGGAATAATAVGPAGAVRLSGSATETAPTERKIHPADGDDGDSFGSAVALSADGTTALVGARGEEEPNGTRGGAAYVLERDGDWTERAKLVAPDGAADDEFGTGVALSADGTTALVGAPGTDAGAPAAGAAHVLVREDASGDDGGWTHRARLDPPAVAGAGARFGESVGLSGDGTTALVGAPDVDVEAGDGAGAATLLVDDGAWTERATVVGGADDSLGFATALSADGSTAVVGVPGDESAVVLDAAGNRQRTLVRDGEDGLFGSSVAVSADGSTALVGAPFTAEAAGSATAFDLADGGQTRLFADDVDAGDQFGVSTALSADGTSALLGAYFDADPNGVRAGSAYRFERDGEWSQRRKYAASDGDSDDRFGGAVALSGDASTALVGAATDEDPNGGGAGSVYAFGPDDGDDGGGDDGSGEDGDSRVRLAPTDPAVGVGAVRRLSVLVDAPRGLSSYRLSVSTPDPATAAVVDAAVPDGDGFTSTSVADDGSSATVAAVGVDRAAGTDLTVAAVTVRGVATGEVALSVSVADLDDRDRSAYAVDSPAGATLSVTESAGVDVTGDGRPSTDPDGDGIHEDVDGDADFDTGDVQALLDDLVGDGDAAGSDLFDVDGDGAVGTGDVQALLDALVGE